MTSLNFINNSTVEVKIFWINFEGGLTQYNTLAPGDNYEQQTYVGHKWSIRDEGDNELMTAEGQEDAQDIEIEDIETSAYEHSSEEDSSEGSDYNPNMVESDHEQDAMLKKKIQSVTREFMGKQIRGSSKAQLDKFKYCKANVDEIIAKGEPWTDPDFPPEFGSICQDGCSAAQFSKSKQYEWKRISELSDEPCIFKDGVQPGDIKQGGLGDCYYLCTLASMAEEESRIMDRFITKEVNAAGIYLMTLYINGEETPVIVDDWLPSQYNQPAFSKCKGGEFWVSLLEKAWAKVCGSYMITEGGFPLMASMHLQGVPGYQFNHDDYKSEPTKVDEFWNTLVHADQNNYSIMSASHGQGEHESDLGVISGHAYSLIAVYALCMGDETVRLCKVRNPWGHGEWKGDWSDESELWTDAFLEQCEMTKEDDGIFCITVEDYLEQYANTGFCVENDMTKYVHNYAQMDMSDRKRAFYNFELKEDIDCSDSVFAVSVNQKGDRLKKYRLKDENKFVNSSFNIVLMKDSTIVKAGCNSYAQFTNSIVIDEGPLEAGKYQLMIDPVWDAETTDKDPLYKQITIDVYCAKDIDLRVSGPKALQNLYKACMKKGRENADKDYYMASNAGLENLYRVGTIKDLNCWLGYLYFNNGCEMGIKQTVTLKLKGMEQFKKRADQGDDDEEGNPVIVQELAAGADDLILLKRTEGSCAYSYGLGLEFM